MTSRRIAALLLVSLLAGCGGASGGAGSAVPVPTAPGQHTGNAQIRITIPAAGATSSGRKRQFIGSDVLGANIGVAPHGSTSIVTTSFDLSSSSTLCVTQSGARTCTLNVNAPFGADDFFVETFDAAPSGGVIPSTAHLLGQASIPNVTVSTGTQAPISISVLGQVNSVTAVAGGQLTVPGDGAAHVNTLIVSGYDYGNIPISGPYSNPITVTVNEIGGSGHTQLVLNGTPSGATAQLLKSSDTLAISYDGGGSAGYYATVSLAAFGATSSSFNVVPMYVTSTSPYYTAANGLQFTAAGQSATLTISEAVGNQSYHINASTSGPCSSAATFMSVSGSGSAATVNVMSGTTAANACPFSVLDTLNSGVTSKFTTTLSTSGVTIGGVTEYPMSGTGLGPGSITSGPDGDIWAGATGATQADRIAPSNGADTPFSTNPHPVNDITSGPDGNLYFVDATNVVERLTTSGTVTQMYTAGAGTSFTKIITGPDANLWVVDSGFQYVYVITPFGTTVNTYTLSGSLTGIAGEPNGTVFVLDSSGNEVFMIPAGSNPVGLPLPAADTSPQNIALGSDGNFYITNMTSGTVEEMSGAGTFTHTYSLPAGSQPRGITSGPDGNIWVAAPGVEQIDKISIATGAITPYGIPTSNAYPIGITTGPDGRVWFAEFSASKIGAITP